MGATAWAYQCPYNPDADTALQQLRHDVFSRRKYSLPSDSLARMEDQSPNSFALPIPDLKKLLNLSKALDQAMAELGAEIEDATKQTKDVEAFIKRVEKSGFASAARSTLDSASSNDPTTIDQAREIAAESGTHSILDIDRVSDTPGFGIATPLSDNELMELFGTIEPSPEMARSAENDGKLTSLRGRWEAVYFQIFTDGKPTQYMFAGTSGD